MPDTERPESPSPVRPRLLPLSTVGLALAVLTIGNPIGGLPDLAPAHAAVSATKAAALTESQRILYESAATSFREGRHAAAFGRFAKLADTGHAPSAESALFMLRNGEELFGEAWSASENQQLRWQALMINGARANLELVGNPADD